MTYVILDDKFHSNGKIIDVGNAGAGLYARALSYCGDQLTDGFVRLKFADMISPRKLQLELVAAGLWRPVEPGDVITVESPKEGTILIRIDAPGYYIDDYLILNPSKASVSIVRDDLRRKRSEAGKRGATARWHPDELANGKNGNLPDSNDGPQPQPQPQKGYLGNAVEDLARAADQADPLERLLGVLTDKDERTRRTIAKIVLDGRLAEGDLAWAQECASGPNVVSPTRVAVAELQKRARRVA